MNDTKPLVQGEPPLRVFVTSVQQETLWAREVAVRELTELDYDVWAFEYTPASSTSAEDAYLPKARDADITVWLVGSETSAAPGAPRFSPEMSEIFSNADA